MKQILLRVPDDVHRRLTERARQDGRSVNALATELLDLGRTTEEAGRRERLRARARAVGIAASQRAAAAPPAISRTDATGSTRGWGELADDLIDHSRDRL